jgi:hypothetical protein
MLAEPRHDESADASTARPRVDYFYDEGIGNYEYGRHHPMRPHRVRMTHHLVVNYGLYKQMNIFRPKPATYGDLTTFHSDEYINFLRTVTPENMEEPNFRSVLERFNICDDCPIFDGLYEYCQAYTGGSIGGAARINQGCSDIVINWAGGLHHAFNPHHGHHEPSSKSLGGTGAVSSRSHWLPNTYAGLPNPRPANHQAWLAPPSRHSPIIVGTPEHRETPR